MVAKAIAAKTATKIRKNASDKLTDKQRLFIAAYLENGLNATRAAQAAGYAGNDNTLRAVGSQNLAKLSIRSAIDAALRDRIMGADEVMARLSEHARASFADFIDERGNIDLTSPTAKAKLHLVHKITQGSKGELIVELQSQQTALLTIAKYHKLLTDRVEVYDWRKEVESAGIPADELFGATVEQMKAALEAKLTTE